MSLVIVRKGETIEEALRRFKKMVDHDGILKEVRKREFYQKPSELRREKERNRLKAIRKGQKLEREIDASEVK